MITQTATTPFKAELLQGIHDFNTDVFKLALYVEALQDRKSTRLNSSHS